MRPYRRAAFRGRAARPGRIRACPELRTNLWGSADYRRRISAPLAIQAVRRAAGIELSAALARELETVQIPKFATDEYSCRRVPRRSSEVR